MNTLKIRAGIIGGAGYTGGETLRLLIHHPYAEVAFVQSRSQAGKSVASVHRDLSGETDLKFVAEIGSADVWFLCLGHGESSTFLKEHPAPASVGIIDLSQDFRLRHADHDFVYGLPEVYRENIKGSNRVANPGCFATALQLGLLPLAKAGKLGMVHSTGITGSTGAGQKLQDTTHFSWRANNISAYKTLSHQHLGEIKQTLIDLQQGFSEAVNFVPWRGDFTRGIFVTSVLSTGMSHQALQELYTAYYAEHPFTIVSEEGIDLKQVVNTNKCLLHIEQIGETAAIHTAIDNLLKGAAGQAVQNMNLMFGFPETSGLNLKPIAF
jgi:N-acetyl-gamma-glutamyl-phosphate reductase